MKLLIAAAGTEGRQKFQGTARKGALKASFAIRAPPPAGMGLKASLQQLKGAAGSGVPHRGREQPDEDVIMLNTEEEESEQRGLPLASPDPSPPRAVLQTPRAAVGTSHHSTCSSLACVCHPFVLSCNCSA